MSLLASSAVVSARELASVIVDAVGLQGVDPAQIDVTTTLFGDGLGLDSLDLLEVALVIHQNYGVKLRANDPNNKVIFASLQSLADHLSAARAAAVQRSVGSGS